MIDVRRELNEIEYFNWCVDQPYNMVVAVRLRGDLQPRALREALVKAQQRHPLLRVNTELGPDGVPWFCSRGVAAIPVNVLEQAQPDDAQKLAERELKAHFEMDMPEANRLPLLRVSLLLPADSSMACDVVFTVQHTIADGLSMVFLVRDLLHFMAEPDAPVVELAEPTRNEDLLPAAVRRKIPTSPFRFKVALWLAKLYVRLRFGRHAPAALERTQCHAEWDLTIDQTTRLRARCRREAVSVQSAICAAFLSGFSAVHTPVNLRPLLARPVGESLGLYVGAAEVKMKYRAERPFWDNARAFQRRLRHALRDPFAIFHLFSKAVPRAMVRELGPLLMRIVSNQRPFAVTNLGDLDGSGIGLSGKNLKVESFFGAVSAILDSSVLTVYTLGERMHLHLIASEASPSDRAIRDDAERAVKRLLQALDA